MGIGGEQVDQCPHGRDGRPPLLLRCKVQFQRANGINFHEIRCLSSLFTMEEVLPIEPLVPLPTMSVPALMVVVPL